MMRRISVFILIGVLLNGCASVTGSQRILYGAGIGGGTGALGGAALSPNNESRGLNALVFGLVGAAIGGFLAWITDHHPEPAKDKPTLKGTIEQPNPETHNFQVGDQEQLPKFVKDRLQPVVIEEYEEEDFVGEDGTLHEPHKVYRIKRPAELFSKPITQKAATQ